MIVRSLSTFLVGLCVMAGWAVGEENDGRSCRYSQCPYVSHSSCPSGHECRSTCPTSPTTTTTSTCPLAKLGVGCDCCPISKMAELGGKFVQDCVETMADAQTVAVEIANVCWASTTPAGCDTDGQGPIVCESTIRHKCHKHIECDVQEIAVVAGRVHCQFTDEKSGNKIYLEADRLILSKKGHVADDCCEDACVETTVDEPIQVCFEGNVHIVREIVPTASQSVSLDDEAGKCQTSCRDPKCCSECKCEKDCKCCEKSSCSEKCHCNDATANCDEDECYEEECYEDESVEHVDCYDKCTDDCKCEKDCKCCEKTTCCKKCPCDGKTADCCKHECSDDCKCEKDCKCCEKTTCCNKCPGAKATTTNAPTCPFLKAVAAEKAHGVAVEIDPLTLQQLLEHVRKHGRVSPDADQNPTRVASEPKSETK